MRFSTKLFSCLLFLLFANPILALAQDAGDEDLEAAFDLKIKAEKIGDFEGVVDLCKSAIEKGLDEEGETEAKTLAASALFEHAEQLMIRLRRQRDPTFYRNEAVKLLKEAVEYDPDMGEGWLLIAKLNALRGGDVDEARAAIDQAIEKLDSSPAKQSESYLLRSIMVQKEDRISAREDLDRAIELNESNVGALRARSTIKIIEGNVEDGLKDVDKILELNDGKVEILLAQGQMLARMAAAKTVAAARKTIAEDSDDPDQEEESDNQVPDQSVEELEADAMLIRESVLDIYSSLVELAPEKEEFHLLKVDAHRALDQKEEALATIDMLIEKDDQSILALQKKAQRSLRHDDSPVENAVFYCPPAIRQSDRRSREDH